MPFLWVVCFWRGNRGILIHSSCGERNIQVAVSVLKIMDMIGHAHYFLFFLCRSVFALDKARIIYSYMCPLLLSAFLCHNCNLG